MLSYKSFILTLFSFFISYALHAQVANYVTSDSKENWNIYSETRVKSLQHLPNNEPLPEDVIYRGVNADQWRIIDKLGDPMNCRKMVYDFQKIKNEEFYEIFPEDCEDDPNCFRSALKTHKNLMIRGGTYHLKYELDLINKNIKGYPGETIILNAAKVQTGIKMSGSVVSNVIIQNAINQGITMAMGNLVHRVVVGNTGVYNKKSSRGIGINQGSILIGLMSSGNCIVSAEAYNGFNHTTCPQCDKAIGGSADGFDAKHGATNATFIDVHGHHNSDHGFDFWNGGSFVDKEKPAVIRVFYSSAVKNGFNPHFKGGNGEGMKLDGEPQQFVENNRHRGRLIYGSVSCFNREFEFNKPGTTRLTFINNETKGTANKLGGLKGIRKAIRVPLTYWGNAKTDDPYALKCSFFNNVKGKKVYDIPMFFSTSFKYFKPEERTKIQLRLKDYGYKAKIDGFWGKGTQRALNNYIEKNFLGDVEAPSIVFEKILSEQ